LIDPVQAVVSVVGVSLIVGLVWLAAGSATASVGDAAAVRERLARELPGFVVGALVVDRNGRAAVARSKDGAELALLFATGKRVTCWSLPAAIAGAKLRSQASGNAVLELETGDFTRPHLKLDLADSASAEGLLALS
jgi:hypothetical protein